MTTQQIAAQKAAADKAAADKAAADRAKAAPASNGATATGRSTETAGVGNKTHPGNLRVPDSVLIKRDKLNADGTEISTSGPEVLGNKVMMVIDVLTSKPVRVFLVDQGVTALTPDEDARLVFVESSPIMDVMSAFSALAKFAVKKDGTVIYGQRGFDDVAHADFDMVDITKLIEHNNSSAGVAADKKLKDQSAKVNADKIAADKKIADEKAAADKKAADDAAKK